jgi:hypothetical protein
MNSSPPILEWFLCVKRELATHGYRPSPGDAIVFEPLPIGMRVSVASPGAQQDIADYWRRMASGV